MIGTNRREKKGSVSSSQHLHNGSRIASKIFIRVLNKKDWLTYAIDMLVIPFPVLVVIQFVFDDQRNGGQVSGRELRSKSLIYSKRG